MINQRQFFNKELMIKEIELNINKLLNTIKKQDDFIEDLEKKLEVANKNIKDLSYAYAKSIGVIRTKKEFKEYLEKCEKKK